MSTQRDWRLVLHNAGQAPARNVHFTLDASGEDGEAWIIADGRGDQAPVVPILAPDGDANFIMIVTMGMASQVLCTVTWEDERGSQSNAATLRL